MKRKSFSNYHVINTSVDNIPHYEWHSLKKKNKIVKKLVFLSAFSDYKQVAEKFIQKDEILLINLYKCLSNLNWYYPDELNKLVHCDVKFKFLYKFPHLIILLFECKFPYKKALFTLYLAICVFKKQ
jgi:hypothetical protein